MLRCLVTRVLIDESVKKYASYLLVKKFRNLPNTCRLNNVLSSALKLLATQVFKLFERLQYVKDVTTIRCATMV